MAKTYLDQLVEYPAIIMQKISSDKYCAAFLLNKGFLEVTEDDFEKTLEENIFDYQYVDETADKTSAYVWVEIEVSRVENSRIKDIKLYVTVACHKRYMALNHKTYQGVIGNRRDNIVRYIDKLINGKSLIGIGAFQLKNVKTTSPAPNFTGRLLCYEIADFNLVDIGE